jgi:hypothetical protein
MKVAVCLSGQLRTWKQCYQTWENLFDELRKSSQFQQEGIVVDYFVHTWDFNSQPYAIWTKELWDQGLYDAGFKESPGVPLEQSEIDEYLSVIKPKQFLVEGAWKSSTRKNHLDDRMIKRMDDTSKWAPISWSGSQMYSIMMADKLKRDEEIATGYEYDMCMRMRNDLYFDENNIKVFCNEFKKPENKKLYSCHSFNTFNFPHDAVGDIFFYSNSMTFDVVCNTFNYLPQIDPDIFPPDVKVESILAYIVRMFDIKIHRLKLDPEVRR